MSTVLSFFPPNILTYLSFDWVIIVVFILIVTFDAMRSGSGRATVIAVSFPLAVWAYGLIPTTFLLSGLGKSLSSPALQTMLFVFLFAILFILIHRTVFQFGGMSGGLLLSLGGAISAAIVVVATWVQEPALQTIWHFAPSIQAVFGGGYTLLWILAAYIILAFVRS